MRQINWIQLIAGFLSGGALGAFIKQYFDNRRNRIQPIGYEIDFKDFYDAKKTNIVASEIIIRSDEKDYKFSKLFVGTIKIRNNGVIDFQEFPFGITTSDKVNLVQIRPNSSDRHHKADFIIQPSLENQVSMFDVSLKPFNRKDIYIFDILFTATKTHISKDDFKISSSKSVMWVHFLPKANIFGKIKEGLLLILILSILIFVLSAEVFLIIRSFKK